MRPLRIKASGTPITGANYQGLQEMSDGEINQYLSNVITQKFADDSDGTGTAELNINGSGTGIGTFVDTQRNDAIGAHPSGGATTTTNYAFNQVTTAVTETVTDFLFCVLDFAIQVDSIYLDELKFEDENYQQSLLEETSILIAVVQATSGFILENNL